ncbi:MAG: hypothetical protein Q8K65_09475 [Alphaproteobacteria bacterium]|nr:hypothetical protein [Alphaproteobacteria bacterium]
MNKKLSLEGTLREFSEMGGRGTPVWAVAQNDDLYYLKSGDLLTVFSDAASKKIVWQGGVDLVDTHLPYPEPNLVQAGMSLDAWRKLFSHQYPVKVTLKNPEKLVF